jgi:hypothetical protein
MSTLLSKVEAIESAKATFDDLFDCVKRSLQHPALKEVAEPTFLEVVGAAVSSETATSEMLGEKHISEIYEAMVVKASPLAIYIPSVVRKSIIADLTKAMVAMLTEALAKDLSMHNLAKVDRDLSDEEIYRTFKYVTTQVERVRWEVIKSTFKVEPRHAHPFTKL